MGASRTPRHERHEKLGRCPTWLDAIQVRLDLGGKRGQGLGDECRGAEDATLGVCESHIHVIARIKFSVESLPGVG